MRIIGLTGGIASGKSAVASYLKELGAVIIDADVIAREVVIPGKKAWQDIINTFGQEILQEDGTINRVLLGEKVFADPDLRKILNDITHPEIIKSIKEAIVSYREKEPKNAPVVVDVPLLFEVGLDKVVDEVWVVYVTRETQLERLVKRDGLSREEALLRIGSQMPLDEKARLANKVIDNNGAFKRTKQQIDILLGN